MIAGSLRVRMMLMFCGVVGVLLTGSSLGIYVVLSHQVRMQLDRQVVGAAGPVLRDLIAEPNGKDVDQLNVPEEYFEVLDPTRRVLQHSQNLADRPLNLDGVDLDASKTSFKTIEDGSRGRLRLCLIPFQRGNETFFLVVATVSRNVEQELQRFRRVIIVSLPLGLLLTGIVSAWYVGRSLRPIAALTQYAAHMAEIVAHPDLGKAWKPLVVSHPHDELGRLADTFNRLFGTVESALCQLRQFVSDASHELRTPLSILLGETELLLSKPGMCEEDQKTLRIFEDQIKTLSHIVEGLFTLAMADAGQLRLTSEPLYLNEVLEETCQQAESIAVAKDIAITRNLNQEVPYFGDEAFLRELFLIFLENAVKYSESETSIRVSLEMADGAVWITFTDQGVGIANEHLSRIFERFYRVAQHDAPEARSGGLGLAIAQAIVSAQGGSIRCESVVGYGSVFTVTLPAESSKDSLADLELRKT